MAVALIFDMDGVIVDSNPVHRRAWDEYTRRHGIQMTEAMHAWMYGKRNDRIVREFFGGSLADDEVFEHGAAKERLYREMIAGRLEQSLVPGLAAFLHRHRARAIGLGTNGEPANVDFVLDAALAGGGTLRRYFGASVCGHDVERPKPDPDIYLKVASLLGVDPGNCVVFEDSHSGVEAARAAGMHVVGVRTTHRTLEGAGYSVDDFLDSELEQWVSHLESA